MPRKTWTEKLNDSKDLPRVEPIPEKMRKGWGEGTIVIPTPREVYDLMSKVPKGKVTTINEIRGALARKHGATIGCPITTGIFARIAASASNEGKGVKKIAYWRTLKEGGIINEKYPGGAEGQMELLQQEGHVILTKGRRYAVQGYKEKLAKLD
jgi:alkylated DNA nucleotide flippase Atl1